MPGPPRPLLPVGSKVSGYLQARCVGANGAFFTTLAHFLPLGADYTRGLARRQLIRFRNKDLGQKPNTRDFPRKNSHLDRVAQAIWEAASEKSNECSPNHLRSQD